MKRMMIAAAVSAVALLGAGAAVVIAGGSSDVVDDRPHSFAHVDCDNIPLMVETVIAFKGVGMSIDDVVEKMGRDRAIIQVALEAYDEKIDPRLLGAKMQKVCEKKQAEGGKIG